MQRTLLICLLAALFVSLAVAWIGVDRRGIVAEEIQPYLRRHPHVLERTRSGEIAPMPPYEPGMTRTRPRWVATSQWPVIAYDGVHRQWPVFLRGHQTGLGAVIALALAAPFGTDIGMLRRASGVLAVIVVLLTVYLAWRTGDEATRTRRTVVAAMVMSLCYGGLFVARMGEAFEVASRTFMMLAIAVAVGHGKPDAKRMIAVGVLSALAILSRAPIAVTLVPALAWYYYPADRRPAPRVAWVGIGLALGLPVILVVATNLAIPFRPGSEPLSAFADVQVLKRLAGAGRQVLLTCAWIGDVMGILRPLHLGEMRLDRTLPLPALVGAVPFVIATVRWRRGRAGFGEQLLVISIVLSSLASALMYRNGNQPQMALPIEPFYALAVAEQIAAVRSPAWRFAAIAAILAMRIQSVASGLYLDAHTRNPMFSSSAQRATLARLRALGARSTEVMTTVYNQAGVLEGWSDETLTPWHAWPTLNGRDGDSRDPLQESWTLLLRDYRPRYVVLTEGRNLFETSGFYPDAIRAALLRVAARDGVRVVEDGHFATESGGPGWGLLRLDYSSPGAARYAQ